MGAASITCSGYLLCRRGGWSGRRRWGWRGGRRSARTPVPNVRHMSLQLWRVCSTLSRSVIKIWNWPFKKFTSHFCPKWDFDTPAQMRVSYQRARTVLKLPSGLQALRRRPLGSGRHRGTHLHDINSGLARCWRLTPPCCRTMMS